MGHIGAVQQRYEVLPVAEFDRADLARLGYLDVEVMTDPSPSVPAPVPTPEPYPQPTPEPVPTPGS